MAPINWATQIRYVKVENADIIYMVGKLIISSINTETSKYNEEQKNIFNIDVKSALFTHL